MATLTNQKTCDCVAGTLSPVEWYGVTDGEISLSPTGSSADEGTWQLVAKVPFATGSKPLLDGMYGLAWLSFSAKSATAGQFAVVDKWFLGGVTGASSPPYSQAIPATGPYWDPSITDFYFSAPDSFYGYVQIINWLRDSGDLEVYFVCKETDGHSNPGVVWDFSDLRIEYQILGSS